MELCFSYKENTPRIWSFAFLIKRELPEYGALLFLQRGRSEYGALHFL